MAGCSPDCACIPSSIEPGKTMCGFIDQEKGFTRPCKASCCKNTCTGAQPETDQAIRPTGNPVLPFGYLENLPQSEGSSQKKWWAPFESSPMYMHEIVSNPGTFTDPGNQSVKKYPLILSTQHPDRPMSMPVDNESTLAFIGTMAVALALLL